MPPFGSQGGICLICSPEFVFYNVEMARSSSDILGSFEQMVLLTVIRLGDDAYGMTVRREISERTGREVSLGAVYSTLERLERKGMVGTHSGASSAAAASRGGRARRFYCIRAAGRRALRSSLAALDQLRSGIEDLAPARGLGA